MKKSEKKLSKLFELLNDLTGKQRKDIKTFVTMSGNHLSDSDEKLINILLDEYGKVGALDEAYFIEKHLEEEGKKKWNKIKNRFLYVLENYLLLDLMNRNQLIRKACLIECFVEKSVEKNYKATVRELLSGLNKNDSIKIWRPLIEYRLSEINVEQSRLQRVRDENLETMNQSLDVFYMEHKLRVLCEQINRNSIVNSEATTSFLIKHLDEVGVEELAHKIQCYYFVYKFFVTQQGNYFQKVSDIVKKHEAIFSKTFLETMYVYLLNFCARQINQGKYLYAIEYLNIVKDQIKRNMFIHDSKITGGKFKNCITIAIIAKQNDWAKDFLIGYQRYLSGTIKDGVVNYCKAFIALYEDKIEDAHEYVKSFISSDLYFELAYDKLILKIYYHYFKNGEYDKGLLLSNIDRLKRYIKKRQVLNQDKIEKNVKFLNYFLKLIRKEIFEIESLLGSIPTADYIWLKKETSSMEAS